GGYSACRQYHEDIARAREEVPGAPRMEKLPHTYLNEHFLAGNRTAITTALADQKLVSAKRIRLVFTAHSVPTRANDEAGVNGQLYTEQLTWAAGQIAADLDIGEWDLVWQSRSGPPQVPWLEPDICDHLQTLADAGYDGVVIAPIGFISDHMEVLWDLDTEAQAKADELGLSMSRAGTVSEDPLYIEMILELIERRLGINDRVSERIASLQGSTGVGVNGAPCQIGCCGAPRD
ncbi:MAG: ferrochelatase, partial [Antricoccus sp.]